MGRHSPAVHVNHNRTEDYTPQVTGMNSELLQKLNARKDIRQVHPKPKNHRAVSPNTAGSSTSGGWKVNKSNLKQSQQPFAKPTVPIKKEHADVGVVRNKTASRWTGPLAQNTNAADDSDDSESEYANENEVQEAKAVASKTRVNVATTSHFPRPSVQTNRPKPSLPHKKPVLPSKPSTVQGHANTSEEAFGVKAMRNRFEQ